jgi:aspartate ammonia-lyase
VHGRAHHRLRPAARHADFKNACITLTSRCIVGIEANREVCRNYVENSIGMVTALNPVIGYEKSAAIAKEALKTGGSVYDLVLEKGWLTQEKLDDMLRRRI